jgi:hypothetical protein
MNAGRIHYHAAFENERHTVHNLRMTLGDEFSCRRQRLVASQWRPPPSSSCTGPWPHLRHWPQHPAPVASALFAMGTSTCSTIRA